MKIEESKEMSSLLTLLINFTLELIITASRVIIDLDL